LGIWILQYEKLATDNLQKFQDTSLVDVIMMMLIKRILKDGVADYSLEKSGPFYSYLRVYRSRLHFAYNFLNLFDYHFAVSQTNILTKKTPWPESASELYRPSDHRLTVKLVPTFADRECHVVWVTDPYGRILGFLDRSRYFLFHVAPQLHSGGWVGPVSDPLLLRKSCTAGNRTRTSGSVARNSDH
jgi:hypothetical protein